MAESRDEELDEGRDAIPEGRPQVAPEWSGLVAALTIGWCYETYGGVGAYGSGSGCFALSVNATGRGSPLSLGALGTVSTGVMANADIGLVAGPLLSNAAHASELESDGTVAGLNAGEGLELGAEVGSGRGCGNRSFHLVWSPLPGALPRKLGR